DVKLYAGLLDGDETADLELEQGRKAWLQVARGSLSLNGEPLARGDGVAIEDETRVALRQAQGAEVLLFDMPAAA
ncbi:MAG: quercetin 2,3-dioxygenase, partial [Xanthomonadales bacterium]|nr:quercetin 2,3-dioxygenase [Xanthomonadales bacterium]